MTRHFFIAFLFISFSCFGQTATDSIPKQSDSIPKFWNITGKVTFLFNQSAFSNWTAGGDNAISGNLTLNYDLNYKDGNWKWDNKIISSYGSSYISKDGYRKTNDRFDYNSTLAYKSIGNWYGSFYANLITQFSRGFDYSKEPKELVSGVFSPTYLSFGPGFLWRKSEDMRVNIAPATSKFTFVGQKLSGNYGVPEGKRSLYELGFNLSGFFKFKIYDDVTMENIINIYSDYLNKPKNIDVNYQANFAVSINKYLSTNITLHLIADDNASSRIQFREIFGLGINYIFHKR